MKIDFFDIKGNYLTDIEISDRNAKMLIRYAILDIIRKQGRKDKFPYKIRENHALYDNKTI